MWQSSNLFDTHKDIHKALLYLRVSSQSKDSGIYNRTAPNTAILRGLMSRGIVIWVMPIPFNVGHCRGITERFKSQIQHNSNYVVFSDSGKSLVTSPWLEVWARTRQRNICAEIPVSRSITSRSERVQRHNAQSDGGKVPTRQRTEREQREMSVCSIQK